LPFFVLIDLYKLTSGRSNSYDLSFRNSMLAASRSNPLVAQLIEINNGHPDGCGLEIVLPEAPPFRTMLFARSFKAIRSYTPA
jgi:hypothetical protein